MWLGEQPPEASVSPGEGAWAAAEDRPEFRAPGSGEQLSQALLGGTYSRPFRTREWGCGRLPLGRQR